MVGRRRRTAATWSLAVPAHLDGAPLPALGVAAAGLLLARHDDGWDSWALLLVAGAALLSTVRTSRRVGARPRLSPSVCLR
jgi:hypothetical protein